MRETVTIPIAGALGILDLVSTRGCAVYSPRPGFL